MLKKENVKIYTAGKTWAGRAFRELRDIHGFNVVARWIDVQDILASPTDTFPEHIHKNTSYLRNIWDKGCKEDCFVADMGLMFCMPEDGEKHSGSLVEIGHITAFNKPVYIIGTCASVEPVGHSDRAWKHQECVYHWPTLGLVEGANKAVSHYMANYAKQWRKNNNIPFSAKMGI